MKPELPFADIEALVAGLRSDDRESREYAYREVIRRYSRLVSAIARRFTNDSALAQDVLQESLLRLFRNIDLLNEPKAFSGFFRRVILSAAYDLMSSTRHEVSAEQIDTARLAYQFDTSYLDLFVLTPYLARLSKFQRLILELEYFQGFTTAEVAERLQTNWVRVRVNKMRALRNLRKWIEDDRNSLINKGLPKEV